MKKRTSKEVFSVGDTVRLKSNLKVGKYYDGYTLFDGMNYGFKRLTVMDIDSHDVLLKGPDCLCWWYSLVMLDMRTIRRKIK